MHPRLYSVFLLLIITLSGALQLHAADDTLRVQLKWRHQFQFAGYYAAVLKGYYAEEKLNVKLLQGDAAHNPVDEVVKGNASFGISGSDLLVHYAQGKPVIALGAVFQHSPYCIISLSEKNICSPTDLVGKKIMVSEGQGWVELQAVFSKEGIPLDSLHPIPHSWNNQDLIDGKADAITGYVSTEPMQFRKLGKEVRMLQSINYGIDFYGDVLFTDKRTMDNAPMRVSRFQKASFRGWDYAMANPEEIIDYILTLPGVKERGVTKEDLLAEAEEMHRLILPDMIEIGHMNEGRWKHILEIYKNFRLVPPDVNLHNFIYNESKSISTGFVRIITYISVILLLIFLLFVVYGISLRRSVRRRTRELEIEVLHRTFAQERLRLSEERLEMATDAAGLGIWDWDIEHNKGYYNDMWKTMLGYLVADLPDTIETFTSLLHPEDRDMLMEQLEEHIAGRKESYHSIVRMKTKDRKWKWILTISKASQRNSEGKATRLSGIHLDIDDIKHKEIELNELTQELMNSNRELQQFAYITSHNLRAPVANLLSLVKLFEVNELSDRNQVFFQKINTSITKLSDTMDDLNEILSSRVHKTDSQEEVVFEKQLRGVIDAVSEEIREKHVLITHDFSKVGSMPYSRKVIDSVLINLITNAIKYSADDRQPEIHVQTEQDGAFVILSVRDNGTGIDMEKYGNKVFGLYQRFHLNKEGKGLGLYLIKNQVESLEGKIAVESIEGKGTMFYVFNKNECL